MEELKNIKVALLGSGTVGTGVYKLIERQREELPHKVGAGLTVSKVLVRDKNKKREGIDPSVLTDQWEDIITDDEIQIVVEVMGGIEPARTYITEGSIPSLFLFLSLTRTLLTVRPAPTL